jgi:hypothetical protein
LAVDERERALVEPGAEVDVDEIHAGGALPHQRFTGARRRDGDVGELENFGTADVVDSDRFHAGSDHESELPVSAAAAGVR